MSNADLTAAIWSTIVKQAGIGGPVDVAHPAGTELGGEHIGAELDASTESPLTGRIMTHQANGLEGR